VRQRRRRRAPSPRTHASASPSTRSLGPQRKSPTRRPDPMTFCPRSTLTTSPTASRMSPPSATFPRLAHSRPTCLPTTTTSATTTCRPSRKHPSTHALHVVVPSFAALVSPPRGSLAVLLLHRALTRTCLRRPPTWPFAHAVRVSSLRRHHRTQLPELHGRV
jgi:hypothetical protein